MRAVVPSVAHGLCCATDPYGQLARCPPRARLLSPARPPVVPDGFHTRGRVVHVAFLMSWVSSLTWSKIWRFSPINFSIFCTA